VVDRLVVDPDLDEPAGVVECEVVWDSGLDVMMISVDDEVVDGVVDGDSIVGSRVFGI